MNTKKFPNKIVVIAFACVSALSDANAQFTFASDNAGNYTTWTGNGGTGFNAWSFNNGASSGQFIGNPSNNGMGTTGIGTTAFGVFSTQNGQYYNATRSLATGMGIGDTLSFNWAMNWDTGAGGLNKGIEFRSGSTNIFAIQNSGTSADITVAGINSGSLYGTTPMLVTITRTSTSQYSFSMTDRDGSGTYTATISSGATIDGFNIFGSNNDNNGNRNVYYNNFANTNSGVFTQGTTVTNNNTFAGSGNLSVGNATTLALGGNATYTGSTTVSNNSTLRLQNSGTVNFASALIGDGALVISNGAGQVNLSGTGTGFTGAITVANGSLEAQTANALGSTAGGTTVRSGGTLRLWNNSGVTYAAEALTLNGAGVSSGGALRNVTNNNTWAGGITLGSSATIASDSGNLTLSGAVTHGGNRLTVSGNGGVIISGEMAGTAGSDILKQGSGALTLSGNNSGLNPSGGNSMFIDQGTVYLNNNNAAGASGKTIDLGSGVSGSGSATLYAIGGRTIANPVTVQGENSTALTIGSDSTADDNTFTGNIALEKTANFNAGSGRNVTFSTGAISGAGGVNKTGLGTVILNGNNAFTGVTSIDAGSLALSGSASLATSSRVNVGAGATFDISGVNTSASVLIISEQGTGDGGAVKLGSKNLTMTGGNTTYFLNNLGVSGDTGSFTLNAGSSTLSLYGASQYTGATTLSAGTLSVGAAMSSASYALNGGNLTTTAGANLSDSASVTLGSASSTFNVGNSDTIGSFAGTAGTVSIGSGVTLTTGDSENTTFSGVISGSGALAKSGAGIFTLSGTTANTYSGTTTVNAGVLVLAKTNVNALAGTPTINNGGTIRLGAANQFAGDTTFLTVNSGGEFDMNGFNETLAIQGAGTVKLGGGTMTINPTAADSFSGVITGDGGIIKTNSGTQVLSGDNAFSGSTTVGQGILRIAHNNALGTTVGATTVNTGAALQLSNGITVADAITLNGAGVGGLDGALRGVSGANTVSGNLTLGSNARIGATAGSLTVGGNVSAGVFTLYAGGSQNSAISGAISGSGSSSVEATPTSLFKDGAGTLTLSGNNSYTGDTRVTAGRVVVASGGSLGSGSDVFISEGASLAIDTSTSVGSLQETGNNNGGVVAIGSGATLTINGANKGVLLQDTISGAGNLAVNASGTTSLSLYGTQSWSGTTTVSGGKLSTGVALATSALTIDGGTFETSAANILGNIAVSLSGGTYALGGADTVGSFSISGGQLNGASTLTAGSYSLSGGTVNAGLGAGAVTVENGTTTLGSSGRLNAASTLTVNSGQLNLGGNETVASLAGSGGLIALGTGTLTTGGGNSSSTFSGVLSGNGRLIKSGTGSLTLSGFNLYSGGTALNGGWLIAGHTNAFGSGSITVGTGTTLNLTDFHVANLIINNGGTILSSGTLDDVVATNGTTDIGGNNSSIEQIGGSAIVNVTGSSVVVSNANGGTLNANGSGVRVDAVSGNATINLGGSSAVVTAASGGTVNANAAGATIGTVSGTAAVNVGGANGRVSTLSGGTVNANAAGLVVTNFNGGNIAVSNGVTVGLRGGSSSGAISGQGGIVKQGPSTLTLAGVNTFSGTTTVEDGKLVVNGSANNSAVTVQSSAILGGGGSVGSLTLNGILAPGNSAGTITAIGGTAWNQGGSYAWEIFDLGGPAGTGWDLISATGGSLDLTGITGPGGFTINLITLQGDNSTQGALNGFDPDSDYATGWMIASAPSITGFNAGEFNLNSSLFVGGTGTFAIEQRAIDGGAGLFITYTAGGGEPIPEPGTWAAAVLLAGAAGYVRWRRRRAQ